MALINLLKSPDPANHKIAAEMPFSNAEWVDAVRDIISTIEDESNAGVMHFSNTFKALHHSYYIQDIIESHGRNHKLVRYFIYGGTILCELRSSDSRIRYLGKGNIKKLLKKLKNAIRQH